MATENDFLSEFEREFELENESTQTLDEFELGNNDFETDMNELEVSDSEFEVDNELDSEAEFEDESDIENETNYLSEFEAENFLNEFKGNGEEKYERRLYEIFSSNYENEFEFENDFNKVMHELQEEHFFKLGKLKKWGKVLAPLAKKVMKAVPGGANVLDGLKQLTKDPRGLLKTLVMKFGPQALNTVMPGAGLALGAVLGNSETSDSASQAARDTVSLAKETYSNFADEISRTNFDSSIPAAKAQLNTIAKNAFKKAHSNLRLGSKKYKYKRVNRKVEDKRNGMYKVVTIVYRRVS